MNLFNNGAIKLTIDDLRKRLKGMNYVWVAKNTTPKLTRAQVAGIAEGTTQKPDYHVVTTLMQFFEGQE
jgi:hypothetical protein